MNDHPLPDALPGLLAGHLAKLNHQLRQLLADPSPETSWADPGPARAVVNRLQVAAALLSDAKLSADPGMAPLRRLGSALSDLVLDLNGSSARLPANLLPPLRRLADFLAECFARLDAGEKPASLCLDTRWEAILAAFFNAGTELQSLDEIEEQMNRWRHRHAERTLSAAQKDALHCRWDQVREFGDILFGVAKPPAAGQAGAGASSADLAGRDVMLLVASPFRQDQLREQLSEAGWVVEVAADPQDMMTRVGTEHPPEVLLCDNLEPSLNLTAVREQLAALTPSARPALVLVAAAGASSQRLRERARRLGAIGAWADPFRLADLIHILD